MQIRRDVFRGAGHVLRESTACESGKVKLASPAISGRLSYRHMYIPRIVRQLLVGTLIIGVLLVITGAGYALYGDWTMPAAKTSTPVQVTATEPVFKHTAPGSNAPESASIQTLSSPVKVGDEASVSVRTLPGSSCTIDIGYTDAPSSKDSGFALHTADEYGTVSWNWAVSAPTGSWPVKVTCVYHNRSAVVVDNLQISK